MIVRANIIVSAKLFARSKMIAVLLLLMSAVYLENHFWGSFRKGTCKHMALLPKRPGILSRIVNCLLKSTVQWQSSIHVNHAYLNTYIQASNRNIKLFFRKIWKFMDFFGT